MQNHNEGTAFVFVRLPIGGPLFEQLEDWRRSQPKIPSRADALRSLIEQALAAPEGATRQADTPTS